MGGSSQYAKPQQQTPQAQQNLGTMDYKPLQPWQVPSTGEEKIGKGIEGATKSITDSLMGAMSAKYMHDQKLNDLKDMAKMYGAYNYMKPDVNIGGD